MSTKILIIEDEPDIAELIAYNIAKEGFEATVVSDGIKGLQEARTGQHDLIVLDLMLPGVQGSEICRALKQNPETADVAIIILTARADEMDKIVGLELGADDYMTKPFSPRELIARMRAVLRRAGAHTTEDGTIKVRDLVIDPSTFKVYTRGQVLNLTTTEFKVLYFLVMNKRKIFSRNAILDNVWENGGYVEPRTVDVHIRRLRSQIEDNPADPKYIKTKRGLGYYFNLDE